LADDGGYTPLIHACSKGHDAVARMLIFEGHANVNARDKQGWTSLLYACSLDNESTARMLVVEGRADVEVACDLGSTLLMAACINGREAVARMLIFEGHANVNARDNDGWTSLLLVCAKGHESTARMLVVEAGADVEARDRVHGDSAFDLALALRSSSRGPHWSIMWMLVVEGKAYRSLIRFGCFVYICFHIVLFVVSYLPMLMLGIDQATPWLRIALALGLYGAL